MPPSSVSSASYHPPPPQVNQQQPVSQAESTATISNNWSAPTNAEGTPVTTPAASTQSYHNAPIVTESPAAAQTNQGGYGQPATSQTYSPPATNNAQRRKPLPSPQTLPTPAPPTPPTQQYPHYAVQNANPPVVQPSQNEHGQLDGTPTYSLPVSNTPSHSSPPPNTQVLPMASTTAPAQSYQSVSPQNPSPPVSQTGQNTYNSHENIQAYNSASVDASKTPDVPTSQPYQPVAPQTSSPTVIQGSQNSYGQTNIPAYNPSTTTTSTSPDTPANRPYQSTESQHSGSQVIQGNQNPHVRDNVQVNNSPAPNNANHWTPPPPGLPQSPPQAPTTAATEYYQPVPPQSSDYPAAQPSHNMYGSPQIHQSYNSAPIQIPPPPAVQQSPPAAAYIIPQYIPGQTNNAPAQYVQPVTYDPSSIAQQMHNLNINNGQQHPPPNNTRAEFQTAKAKQPPPIIASGEPREVVRFCNEGRVINYSLYWYRLPDVPEFLICTKCHEDHIESTPLAKHFERILGEAGTPSTCHFYHPRTKEVLWKQALRSNNLDEFRTFAKRRLTIPNCKEKESTVGKEGIKYFGMQNNDIDGFIACEACYEDKIIGTSFERNFTPNNNQGAEDKWTCDVAITYVSRAIEELSKKNDWSSFIEGVARRIQHPVCEGKDSSATEGTWYHFRREMEDFHVCGTCYMDRLELTPFESEFEQFSRAGGFDQWMSLLGTRWTCKMPSSNLPILFALDAGISEEDFDGFWNKAQALNKLVPCTANGIIRGNWWTLPGGCPDFSICEACYIGIFQTHEVGQFLEPAQRSSEDTIVCSFCPASGRFNQFFNKFVETLDRSVFSYYADCVRTYASILPCAGINHREKTKWWGYVEALFCENCWVSFVSETSLGPHVQFKGEFDERAQICQVWSPRMRGMWMDACNAGPPGSAESDAELAKFKAFGERRLQVYIKTVPRIKQINAMREIKMAQALHQGHLSLMYQGMNSTAVLSGTNDGYLHGNSSLGYYETEDGATAAQMFNNMQSGMADATTGGWSEIMRLQVMWTEVE